MECSRLWAGSHTEYKHLNKPATACTTAESRLTAWGDVAATILADMCPLTHKSACMGTYVTCQAAEQHFSYVGTHEHRSWEALMSLLQIDKHAYC